MMMVESPPVLTLNTMHFAAYFEKLYKRDHHMDFPKLSFLSFLVDSWLSLSPCAISQHDTIGSTVPSEELESEVLEECRARQDRLFRAELQDSVASDSIACVGNLVVGDFYCLFYFVQHYQHLPALLG